MEGAGAVPRAALPRGGRRRAGQRAQRPPGRACRVHRRGGRRRPGRRARRHRHRPGGGRRAVPRGPSRPRPRRRAPGPRDRAWSRWHRRRSNTRGSISRPSVPTTPASSRTSTRWCSPTRTPPSGSRTPSAGALETTADVMVDYFTAQAGRTPERARELCSAVRCPVLVVHGTDDRVVPHEIGAAVAEWTGGALVTRARRRPRADGARPGEGQPADPRLRPVRHRHGRAPSPRGRRRGTGTAERCSSPHRSGSATPDATSPSPTSCASGARTWRSSGWPSTPSPRSWRPRASGCTRRRGGWRTSPRTSRPRPGSTTCTPSRPCARWTRSSSRTSTCSTT